MQAIAMIGLHIAVRCVRSTALMLPARQLADCGFPRRFNRLGDEFSVVKTLSGARRITLQCPGPIFGNSFPKWEKPSTSECPPSSFSTRSYRPAASGREPMSKNTVHTL
jgi:hypothetical protein